MTPTVTSTMTHAADLSTLLPHRAPMVLVDGVEHADCDECVASFAVPAESPWVEDGLLMRAAFVEIAAQTAALHAGLAAREAGGVPRNGYLGMVSRFRVHGDAHVGDVLRSTACRSTEFGTLTRVECRIERVADGAPLADGVLTVALTH